MNIILITITIIIIKASALLWDKLMTEKQSGKLQNEIISNLYLERNKDNKSTSKKLKRLARFHFQAISFS